MTREQYNNMLTECYAKGIGRYAVSDEYIDSLEARIAELEAENEWHPYPDEKPQVNCRENYTHMLIACGVIIAWSVITTWKKR
jgi:hypothetical protein